MIGEILGWAALIGLCALACWSIALENNRLAQRIADRRDARQHADGGDRS